MKLNKYLGESMETSKKNISEAYLLRMIRYEEPRKCCGSCIYHYTDNYGKGSECQNDKAFEVVLGIKDFQEDDEYDYPRVEPWGVCRYYED